MNFLENITLGNIATIATIIVSYSFFIGKLQKQVTDHIIEDDRKFLELKELGLFKWETVIKNLDEQKEDIRELRNILMRVEKNGKGGAL